MKKNLFALLRVRRRSSRAFSLTETVIALLILSIAILAVAAIPIMSSKLMLQATQCEQATAIGIMLLDMLESDENSNVVNNAPETGYEMFFARMVKSGDLGSVSVTWKAGSLTLERHLSIYSHKTRRTLGE